MAARRAGLFDREEARARVFRLVAAGSTVKAAAGVVGVPAGTATLWARQAGVHRPKKREVEAAARAEAALARERVRTEAVGLMRDGCTGVAAAARVGVSVATVTRWARLAGVSLRGHRVHPAVRERFWETWRVCHSIPEAARVAGVSAGTAVRWIRAAGLSGPPGRPRGVPTPAGRNGQDTAVHIDVDAPPGYRLSVREREEIAWYRSSGLGVRVIAARIGRPASTISRELKRNTGPDGRYRVLDAERSARRRARRPKSCKLAEGTALHDLVQADLDRKLSPEQIAHRLPLEHPDEPELRVCHETIYQAVYVQARGGLKREVEQALRRGRAHRQPRRREGERRGRIPNMVPIAERPPEVDERIVPGHWEGDLIIGKDSASAVATLVERVFRFTMLGHLPEDHTAPTVRDAIVPLIANLPAQLRKTLTWDQGSEMACHLQVADQAHIQMYFADPHSPWQRGTNENTNGLLRQYLPKGTDLSVYSPADLQAIADELNDRPRKALGWLTPNEAYHLYLGHTVVIGGRPAHLPDNLMPTTQCCVDP